MLELLGHLLPKFRLAMEPGIQVYDLGVIFWTIMMVIMAVACFFLAFHRIRFGRRLKRLKNLINTQDEDSLAVNRREILEKALKQDPEETGKLWREFDESLVYSADKKQLFNTLDAEHFFNGRTLAPGLTSSRLLSATPTFLTAIGVLGTFVGLTLGLADIQVNADKIDTLKSGVSTMINGAAVAFMTSVWGVGLSLVLNVIEKLVERSALNKIRQLQQKIDYLYPRIPVERSLVQIEAASNETKEALQELHERIGDRLQEAVSGVGDSMQQAFTDAINKVMGPAVQALVDNTSQQSSAVLEKLVTNFMEGMKSAGSEQGARMQAAAEDLRSAIGHIGGRIETLFKTLDEQQLRSREQTEAASQRFAHMLEQLRQDAEARQEEMEKRYRQLAEQLGSASQEQVDAIRQAASEQQSRLGQAFENAVSSLNELLAEQARAAAERETQLENRFRGQLDNLSEKQQQLLAAVAEGTQQAQRQMAQMAEQHRSLMHELNAVTRSVESSSQHMSNSSTQLGVLSANLKQATEILDTRLQAVTASLKNAGEQNRSLAEQLMRQAQMLKQLQDELNQAIVHFGRAAELAESGFRSLDQHQRSFLEGIGQQFRNLGASLQQQVKAVEEQAAEWLQSYSREVRTQVSERMEQWNETTLQFADEMRRTVNAISGIVDDLEQKV
ncbi:anti-phage ZorAB system protein ZorA [Microbulbifer thermotolerans]|uniref:anti-phage ZorAB system protein ZorA n=1 Tax=Microbulbifer thermotolerans TaxID=252514 RepID=UPI0022490C24|nr:anti-phage ZorAB system protein ZorA [Microbulbifer thermotolerans]MCX2779246.1 anti-phage ZorAB system protein ZorA [Microbulbifer thermotolerans]MCX2803670.1 anti-phage ZorAB system protein ZorA [Microbulbifer thermotolerans]MCX2830433.1 anti-phage ZorAB system protein ZorA [Microbulbifer thermotolerans]